ncbi:MAG TPA: four helix bundle protein [Tepidisphaeraceae bacterium]
MGSDQPGDGPVAGGWTSFAEWQQVVPVEIKGDTLWLVEAYRLALYLGDLGWHDANALTSDRRMMEIADQLRRATSRISASVAEGYSRDSGKGRATYYEYAAGSARESRDWYYKGRYSLPEALVQHRAALCTQIIRLTLTMIANERRRNRRVSDQGTGDA